MLKLPKFMAHEIKIIGLSLGGLHSLKNTTESEIHLKNCPKFVLFIPITMAKPSKNARAWEVNSWSLDMGLHLSTGFLNRFENEKHKFYNSIHFIK